MASTTGHCGFRQLRQCSGARVNRRKAFSDLVMPNSTWRTPKRPAGGAIVIAVTVAVSLTTVRCSSTEPAISSVSSESPVPASVPGRTLVVGKASRHAIVTLEPTTPHEFSVPAEPGVMDQFGMAFIPELLLVQAGQQVEFRNSEDVLHNVRVDESLTRTPVFNVAIPPFATYEHTFARPGYHNVSCDVHPGMWAGILVTSTPYATVADSDGAFTLANVLAGLYRVTVMASGRQLERVVEITGEQMTLVFDGPE